MRAMHKIVEMLELPKEVAFNLPVIQVTGAEDICISNYKGLIEYSDQVVRVSTSCGSLRLEGKALVLVRVTAESLVITGRIKKIELMV